VIGGPLLDAAGAMRPAYERVDWSSTAVGPVAGWSPALRNALGLALHTRFPVTLMWGPEFVLLYNQAYVSLIADKHPCALGRPAQEGFAEAWDVIGPMMQGVLDGRGATYVEDASVPLERHGRLREAYFTFSYSPVRGAGGVVEGVMDIATDTTRQVIDRRRLVMLGRLREMLASLERVEEVRERALPLLWANALDLPAVDIELEGLANDGDGGGWVRFPLGSAREPGRPPVLASGSATTSTRTRATSASSGWSPPRSARPSTGSAPGRPSAASPPPSAAFPRHCSAACSPSRCNPTTSRSPCAICRPPSRRRSAGTGTTPSWAPTGP
jgi:hypothetical protein